MHGVSLLPLFAAEPATVAARPVLPLLRKSRASTAWRATTACARERYKLVYYYQNDEWELFDLQTDPGDQVNLYGKPGYDDITRDLQRRLQALRAQYQVPEDDPQAPWYHDALVRAVEQLMM